MLNRLVQTSPDAVDLTLVRRGGLTAQGRNKETERLLVSVRDKHPESTELWAALAKLADRQQQAQRAVEVLDQAEEKFGDRVWIRLAAPGTS